MQRSRLHLFGVVVLVVVMATSTACAAKSGAAGVRDRLNGYPDLGWPNSKIDRFGARVCGQFPNGVFADPRVAATENSNPAYVTYVDPHPRPRWITWFAPWIWQVFFDSYCSKT